MENPFQFGRELGADELVNRREEVTEVISAISEGSKLFLIGPRRYGKTSILKASSDRLSKEKAAAIFRYDAEAFPGTQGLVNRIITDAAASLNTPVEKAGEAIMKYFSRLQPELSFNATRDSWSAKVALARGQASEDVKLLVDALDGLEHLALEQPAERPVGLVIDEFQKLVA